MKRGLLLLLAASLSGCVTPGEVNRSPGTPLITIGAGVAPAAPAASPATPAAPANPPATPAAPANPPATPAAPAAPPSR